MVRIAVIASNPEYRRAHRSILSSAGHEIIEVNKFDPLEAAEAIAAAKPSLVVLDCGGTTMSLLKEIRRAVAPSLSYVVVVEEEGSMFLSHLSTPRLQYISGRSRTVKLLDAVDYALAGKSTLQRLQENNP